MDYKRKLDSLMKQLVDNMLYILEISSFEEKDAFETIKDGFQLKVFASNLEKASTELQKLREELRMRIAIGNEK